MLASPSAPDDNILLDDDAKRPARTDAKRRLDIEIAGYKLITRPSSALLRGFADGANTIAFALAPSAFGSTAEQGRERATLQELPRVVVDIVGLTRITLLVGRRPLMAETGRSSCVESGCESGELLWCGVV